MELNRVITISFLHLSYCGRAKGEIVPARRPRADVSATGNIMNRHLPEDWMMMDDVDAELVLGRRRELGVECWRALREYEVEIRRRVPYKK